VRAVTQSASVDRVPSDCGELACEQISLQLRIQRARNARARGEPSACRTVDHGRAADSPALASGRAIDDCRVSRASTLRRGD
jgi:hypothetical protein